MEENIETNNCVFCVIKTRPTMQKIIFEIETLYDYNPSNEDSENFDKELMSLVNKYVNDKNNGNSIIMNDSEKLCIGFADWIKKERFISYQDTWGRCFTREWLTTNEIFEQFKTYHLSLLAK